MSDTEFPSDWQREAWAELLEQDVIRPESTLHLVSAFLRSPRLREAMRTLEAVEYCRANHTHVLVERPGERPDDPEYPALGWWVTNCDGDECAVGATLPEAVSALRQKLEGDSHDPRPS